MRAVLCGVLGVLLAGCATKPTAEITEMRVRELTFERAVLETVVRVKNPYEFPLPLVDYSQRIDADGRRVFSASVDTPGWSVAAKSSRLVKGSASLNFNSLLQVVGNHYSKGTEIPYETVAGLAWKSPWGPKYEFPELVARGDFPIPKVPEVWLRKVPTVNFDMGSLDNPFTSANEGRAGRIWGMVFLKARNGNQFAVRLTKIEARLTAQKPGGSGRIELGRVSSRSPENISRNATEDVDVSYSGPLLGVVESTLLAVQAFTDPGKFRLSGTIEIKVADLPLEFSF